MNKVNPLLQGVPQCKCGNNNDETMASDWQLHKTLQESNEYMLNNELSCDVTFLAGENQSPVKAHKYMLVSRSPVFYAMFCGHFTESHDSVKVKDIEPDVLKSLFRYLYTGSCPITENDVTDLLYGARKYTIPGLELECMIFLEDKISKENICIIIKQAFTFDDKELTDKCMKYIQKNASEVLKSDGFQTLTREQVKHIISCDELEAIDEVEVYKACKRWGEIQCQNSEIKPFPGNVREVLGDILYSIRFPIMTVEDFTTHVTNDGILDAHDIIDLYQHFAIGKGLDSFNMNERKDLIDMSKIVNIDRFSAHGVPGWTHNYLEDAISFSVTRNVYLIGLTLFLPCSTGEARGKLNILENTTILRSKTIVLRFHEAKVKEDVRLDKPLLLQSDVTYTVSQTLVGVATHFGSGGKSEITIEDGTIFNFMDSTRSQNGTQVTSGQFASLLIVPANIQYGT